MKQTGKGKATDHRVSGSGGPPKAASGTAKRTTVREPARSPLSAVPRDRLRLSPRQVALELLVQQEQQGRPLDQVLAEYPPGRWPVDRRDRQLVRALVYEVLRRRGFLDQVLARYAKHPLAKMKPLTLAALRLGLAQLLFFERLPPAAAIDETIRALKAAHQPRWLTGFVNGLLRNTAREREDLLGQAAQQADWLSVPPWLRQRREQQLGPELARRRSQAENQAPPLVLRVNPVKIQPPELAARLRAAGLEVEEGYLTPAALRLPTYHGRVEELPGFADGWLAVQDEAAQLVTMLLAGAPSADQSATPLNTTSLYLDACAGLGGKTAHLAELLPLGAGLVALEPHAGRFALLGDNLHRLGIKFAQLPPHVASEELARRLPTSAAHQHPVMLGRQTLESFAALLDSASVTRPFQGILLDAPCSGLGVVRRHPDIRWNRRPEDLRRYQQQQIALLQKAVELLAPGGMVVYVVCSNEPEENREVIDAVMRRVPGLAITDPRALLPPAAAALVDREGFFRCGPETGLDGFFAARLTLVANDA
ncbi:RsmB/NOP family class I SAM-dependent RNA methyltransferase [Desulfurivibrio dismutans]|uniref:RsmB/NOP family class I SAM-dependent RNA methyltransferase n=1 Tax=Desulfurivibrio dismutans TaxID=1398908 RepID=UPI0023DB5093|nr:transcription antitermination factor NusB [Desulfurivibrio alkaliphilus]MDF1615719.1 transcription antitermination factor NusB [Desulfurivibrio alkaliphilus]